MFQITINTQVISSLTTDLNQDAKVNLIDLAMFSSQWLDTLVTDPNATPDPNTPPTPDFNSDTHVDLNDFVIMNSEWQQP